MSRRTWLIVVIGVALGVVVALLGACGNNEPQPSATWEPGRIMPRSTVKSKQIIRADPKNASSAVTCYEVVLEWSARTDRYCVTKRLWEQAKPGELMTWE